MSTTANNDSTLDRKRNIAAFTGVMIFSFLYVTMFLKTQNHWWFEDDPTIYLLAAKVSNPVSFFIDKQLMTSLGVRNEIIPMLHLSFWVDFKIAPFSVKFAYWHSNVLFILTSCVLYIFVWRLLKSRLVAMLLVFAWMCLPSTIATHEFLSARCYMEGMLYSLLAILAVQNALAIDASKIRVKWLLLSGFFCLLATLSKEFFPTSTLTFLFLFLLHQRAFKMLVVPIGVGIIYACLRLYMLDFDLSYGQPQLNFSQYLNFLSKIPYIFAGNSGGYQIFASILIMAAFSRKLHPNRKVYAFIGINILIALLTIFPVSYAIDIYWKTRGTWYRSLFVLNTVLLVTGAVIASVSEHKKYFVPIFLLLLASYIPHGAMKTRRTWDQMTTKSAAEGRFIVENTEKVLLTNDFATWFLPGVTELYKAQNQSVGQFVNCRTYKDHLDMIQAANSIWTYDGEKVKEVPELRAMLLNQTPSADYCGQ